MMNKTIARENFLEPEIRDGVAVSAEMKAAWKVLLDMLEEFIRICEKYDLKYCLDGGTMLGAIRHKGFVPWDDDVDVSLPRADFQRFLAEYSKEGGFVSVSDNLPLWFKTHVLDCAA